MIKRIILFSLLLCAMTSAVALSLKYWRSCGNPDFSGPGTNYGSLVVSASGTPYASFETGDGVFSVMKMQNGVWNYVGNQKIATYVLDSSLAASLQGPIYLAYTGPMHSDGTENTHVMKFDGREWIPVGAVLSGDALAQNGNAMAVSNSGVPYVAIYTNNGDPEVEAFEHGQWTVLGNANNQLPPNTNNFSLAIDPSGTPYVAMLNPLLNNSTVSVMSWNGIGWNLVGSPIHVDQLNGMVSLAFSPEGAPYLAYGYSFKKALLESALSVFELTNGDAWTQLGKKEFLSIYDPDFSLLVSQTGVPYVSYSNYLHHYDLSVMSWNQNKDKWISVGNTNISGPVRMYTALATDPQNNLYVLYEDAQNKGKASVKILK